MKKLFTLVVTMLLGAALSFGQATGGSTDKPASGKKATSTTATTGKKNEKKGHKGGKKSKKGSAGSSGSTTPK